MTSSDAKWNPPLSSEEVSVLRADASLEPPTGAVERALVILAAAGATGSLAGAAAAASGTAGKTHLLGMLKWFAVLGVGSVVGSAIWLARPLAPGAKQSKATPSATASQLSVEVAAPNTSQDATTAQLAPAAAAAVSASSGRESERGSGQIPLKDEIAIIDAARGSLRRGDARGALDALDRYDSQVKHAGSLRSEATVVRVEALLASGNPELAARLGERFIARNPGSAYADHLRRILKRQRPE